MPYSMLGSFRNTVVEPATTNTPETWTNNGPFKAFLVLATVDVYLRRDVSVTANDMLLLANEPARLVIETGGSLSWMATATNPSGSIRITELGEDWG